MKMGDYVYIKVNLCAGIPEIFFCPKSWIFLSSNYRLCVCLMPWDDQLLSLESKVEIKKVSSMTPSPKHTHTQELDKKSQREYWKNSAWSAWRFFGGCCDFRSTQCLPSPAPEVWMLNKFITLWKRCQALPFLIKPSSSGSERCIVTGEWRKGHFGKGFNQICHTNHLESSWFLRVDYTTFSLVLSIPLFFFFFPPITSLELQLRPSRWAFTI